MRLGWFVASGRHPTGGVSSSKRLASGEREASRSHILSHIAVPRGRLSRARRREEKRPGSTGALPGLSPHFGGPEIRPCRGREPWQAQVERWPIVLTMRNWEFYLACAVCGAGTREFGEKRKKCLRGLRLKLEVKSAHPSREGAADLRSAFRRTPRPRDRRLSESHCLANVDNRDNIDVVPEGELRDKRVDDLRVVGLDQAVAGGPREVLHKSLDTQALLLLWLPLAEGGQDCFHAR